MNAPHRAYIIAKIARSVGIGSDATPAEFERLRAAVEGVRE